MKIVKVSKWLLLVLSLGGLGAAGYMYMKSNAKADITPVQKANSSKPIGISRVMSTEGHDNYAMSNEEGNKF